MDLVGCFQWLMGSRSSTEVIKPSKLNADSIMKVPKGEQMFGMMPLCFATYPAIAMRLPKCDEKRLKQSLSKALDLVPKAAGRYARDAELIVLNAAGVPFTVVESSEESAPPRVEEKKLLHFATFLRPWGVRYGLSAPMAVKLTIYKDGSGILAFSRSHMLFDGGSAWTFLHIWASLARGDSVKAPPSQQDYMQKLLPGDQEFHDLAVKKYGVHPKPSVMSSLLKNVVIPVVGAIIDTFFLHVGWSLTRYRLFFSDDDLALLKEEATPKEVPADMDNWVTTQEALCAHMLLAFRPLLKETSTGNVGMMFLLDSRKALGLASNQIMGNGLTFTQILIPTQQFLRMDLPTLAMHLHHALAKKEGSLQCQQETWRTLAGACERGVQHSLLSTIHKMKDMDLKFAVNNSSKRGLPDFGDGHSCQSVITNAGPTIFLPGDGGIDVHLDPSVFSGTGATKGQKLEVLRAMSALPKKLQ